MKIISIGIFLIAQMLWAQLPIHPERKSFICENKLDVLKASPLTDMTVGPGTMNLNIKRKQFVLRPFTSDGCSSSPGGPPWDKSKSDLWQDCCFHHDMK